MHVYICMCVCVDVRASIPMHVYICMCVYVCIYMCACIQAEGDMQQQQQSGLGSTTQCIRQ
jgi:hypothetical protein